MGMQKQKQMQMQKGVHFRMNDLTRPHPLESWSVGGPNVGTAARGGRTRPTAPFGVCTLVLRRWQSLYAYAPPVCAEPISEPELVSDPKCRPRPRGTPILALPVLVKFLT